MDGEGRIVIQGSNIFDLLRRVPLTLFAVEDFKKIKKTIQHHKKVEFLSKGYKNFEFLRMYIACGSSTPVFSELLCGSDCGLVIGHSPCFAKMAPRGHSIAVQTKAKQDLSYSC